MTKTFAKTIRITAEQWDRIVTMAAERDISANQLLVELAMEALERREWPRTEAEIHVARATMFVALALELDLISAGREAEAKEIHEIISSFLPEPAGRPHPSESSKVQVHPPLIAHAGTLRPELAGQIERMYRGVYLLSTLKRDEMLREGREEELERIHQDAYDSQDSLRDQTQSIEETGD